MAHVIVCGLGQLGFRVAGMLIRLGEDVTVVTRDTRQEFLDLIIEAGAKVVEGDARAEHVLQAAQIETADALIACVDDDVLNIEIALDARKLNPAMRIVPRIFDQTLAKEIEGRLGFERSLSMSVVAAPSFAFAAFDEKVDGVIQTTNGAQVVFGEQAVPMATMVQQCVVMGRHVRLGLEGRLRETFRMVRRVWREVPKVLKIVFAVVAIAAVLSVFVFNIGMNLSPLDAVYFVVTTLTTTGYGDITLHNQAGWLKVYGCFLMVVGTASVAALYSLLTDFIVSARFDRVLGRRTVTLEDHVVLVGLGNVGYRIVENLVKMGTKVAVVESDPDAPYRQFLPESVMFTAGDGRDSVVLERAGAKAARAVVVATQNDAVNLSVGLMARSISGSCRVVVRLSDPEFAQKVEQSVNVNSALVASQLAAPAFVGAALDPDSLFSTCDEAGLRTFIAVEDGRIVHRHRKFVM